MKKLFRSRMAYKSKCIVVLLAVVLCTYADVAAQIVFDFETAVNEFGEKEIFHTKAGYTLEIQADKKMERASKEDLVINGLESLLIQLKESDDDEDDDDDDDDDDFKADDEDSDRVLFSLKSGEPFDLKSIKIKSKDCDEFTLTVTSASGSINVEVVGCAAETVNIADHTNASRFKNISFFTLSSSEKVKLAVDDVTVTNLHTVDQDPPVVQGIALSGSPAAGASSVTYTVNFNEKTNNISTDDFVVTTTSGDATGAVSSVGAGSGTSVPVVVGSITGAGKIRLDLKGSTNLADDAGNGNGNNGYVTAYTGGAVHTVDRKAPKVASVSGPPDGTYGSGDKLNFTINFNESVAVNTSGGTPRLGLTVGSSSRQATYLSGSGTSALTFNYTVQSGDSDSDGIGIGTLSLNGGTCTDAAGNNAELTLNNIGDTGGVLIAASVSSVSSVTVPADGSYGAGDRLDFTVNFSENVVVNTSGGTPGIGLTIGSSSKVASYVSGSGSSALLFRYTVAAGDNDTDGISVGALSANGGTVQDAGGNNVDLTLKNVASTAGVLVDAALPVVANVSSSTPDGTYGVGDVITLSISFSEEVNVSGSPKLELETGATDRVATYKNGSGSANITFSYTVQSGDVTADLGYTNSAALVLNGGSIRDVAGNNAQLTLPAPGAANSLNANKAISIDGVAPTVDEVNSSSADGTYEVGDAITITVKFTESVQVTGSPSLALETGAVDRTAIYSSGSGTTLTFRYTVQAGDVSGDLDYTSVNALELNGAAIRDGAGNNASLTLPAPGSSGSLGANKALVIDGNVPQVTGISSSTANGSYKAGSVIGITVSFSEQVVVGGSGTPVLQLETGSNDRTATYVSGSGSTVLTFNYTVQAGDASSDLDYTGTAALQLNGGTIKDNAGNNAQLTLPAPGASGSLASNKNLIIDTTAPSVKITSSESSPTASSSIPVTVTFSEEVSGFTSDDIMPAGGSVKNFSGSGSTYTFNIAPSADGAVAVNVLAGVAADKAGNENVAATQLSWQYDGTAPTVTISSGVTSPTNRGSIPVKITFSEPVRNFTSSDVSVSGGNISAIQSTDNQEFTGNVSPSTNGNVKVEVKASVATDAVGNGNEAAGPFSIVYDGSAPIISSLSPADNALGVSVATDLILTFNEPVAAGTGDIVIRRASDNSPQKSISVTDPSQVSISGRVVTVNPTTPLLVGTSYYVEVPYRAFVDEAGNIFSGINGATNWNFTTINQTEISINDPSVTEGNSGAKDLTFTVTLSRSTTSSVEVSYSTSNGTASAGVDYTATSGKLSFSPGQTSKEVKVTVQGDNLVELDETVNVTLSNAVGSNVLILDDSGTGTITNDDIAKVTIADASGKEDAGAIRLTATLDNAVQGSFSIQINTADGTAKISDNDYARIKDQQVSFSGTAGESKTFNVTPTADQKLETDEVITIKQSALSVPGLAVDISDEAKVTILNDDNARVDLINVSGKEDDGKISVAAVLDRAVQGGFTLKVKSSDGTATLGDKDYEALKDKEIKFNGVAGEIRTADLTVNKDDKTESDETLFVLFSEVTGTDLEVVFGDASTVTIFNDDYTPVIDPGQVFVVSDSDKNGTVIGRVSGTDADDDKLKDWKIVGGNSENIFSIRSGSGDLILEDQEAFTEARYSLTLTVSDGTNVSDEETVDIIQEDNTRPTVKLTSEVGEKAEESPVPIEAEFSEPVSGFTAADIMVINGSVVDFSTNDDQIFSFSVTAAEDGEVEVSIPDGATTDIAGNPNKPSNVIKFYADGGVPTAELTNDVADVTIRTDAIVTVTFSEPVEGLNEEDFTVSSGTLQGFGGQMRTYSFAVVGIQEGPVAVVLKSGAVTDLSGNVNPEARLEWEVDHTGPSEYLIVLGHKAINPLNESNTYFSLENAEDLATFTYSIESAQTSTDALISGSGQVSGTSATVDGLDLSGFPDGELILKVIMTDSLGNIGPEKSVTFLKDIDIQIPQGISPDGDGANDTWIIPGIEHFPENQVTIFNRWGTVVYKVENYNNTSTVFAGSANNGVKLGTDLPDGTYFYVLEMKDRASRKGYLIIRK